MNHSNYNNRNATEIDNKVSLKKLINTSSLWLETSPNLCLKMFLHRSRQCSLTLTWFFFISISLSNSLTEKDRIDLYKIVVSLVVSAINVSFVATVSSALHKRIGSYFLAMIVSIIVRKSLLFYTKDCYR